MFVHSPARTPADLTQRANAVIGLIGLAAVAASLATAPGVEGIFGAGLALLMLAIAISDARRFIIPNVLTAAGFALALLHAGFQARSIAAVEVVVAAALRGAVLVLAFLTLRIIYARLRERQGLGLGDVKLAGVAGAWLDWLTMPIAIEIAALAALSIYVLRYYVIGRPIRATSRLPFGLFFAPAIWLGWLLEATLFRP
jgi:leader peptidase (prepilin peptidase)/N-methyltransferase